MSLQFTETTLLVEHTTVCRANSYNMLRVLGSLTLRMSDGRTWGLGTAHAQWHLACRNRV